MKKLTKEQIKQRDELSTRLASRREDFNEALENYNAAKKEAWIEVAQAIDAINEAIEAANEWKTEIASAIQEYVDNKSEKWQEGDTASEYGTWKEAYEEEFEKLEIEEPDDVEHDCEAYDELIDQLPEGLNA